MMFRDTWDAICANTRRDLRFVKEFARINPTAALRILFNRSDLHAVNAGDVLHMWPCYSVQPLRAYWDHKHNGKCYEELPVLVELNGEQRIMFKEALSSDLIVASTVVDCNNRPMPIHWRNGQWTSSEGIATQVIPPFVQQHRHEWRPFVFKAPPPFHNLYSVYQYEGLKNTKTNQRLRLLERQMGHLVDYSAATSTKPSNFKLFFQRLGNSTRSFGRKVGHAFGKLALGTKNLLVSLGHSILSPLFLIIKIIMGIAIFIAILVTLYYVGRPLAGWCFIHYARRS
jgi:hypothetical protein